MRYRTWRVICLKNIWKLEKKVDIEEVKVDIQESKVDIDNLLKRQTYAVFLRGDL